MAFRHEQSVVLGLGRRIEADRDEGWHVEGLAQRTAAAAADTLAAALAGVAGDRGEAGETGQAFVLDGAKLGHAISRVSAVASPTPVMLTRMSKRACKAGSAVSAAGRAVSIAAIWRRRSLD